MQSGSFGRRGSGDHILVRRVRQGPKDLPFRWLGVASLGSAFVFAVLFRGSSVGDLGKLAFGVLGFVFLTVDRAKSRRDRA